MSSKCILFISPSGKGGGTLASIKLLDSVIHRTDSGVTAITLGRKSSRIPSHSRLRWVSIPWFVDYDRVVRNLERSPLLAFLYTFPILSIVSLLIGIRLRKDVVLVYGNGGICGITAAIIAKLLAKKSIAHIHTDTGLSERSFLLRWFYRKALSKVDHILANLSDVESDLVMLGLPRRKISVVINWVNREKFKPLDRDDVRHMLGFKGDEFISLYVGRFVDYKGIRIVLDVAKETVERDIFFVFIGHGPLEKEVKNLAGQRLNIRFVGLLEDEDQLAQYYNAADILALGAIDGNRASLTAMEALACGLPVMVSNRPAARREGIRMQRTLPSGIGFLIDPDPKELKRKISYLKENRQLLGSMRVECCRFAEENFSECNIENVYQEIFEPLLNPKAEGLQD